MMKRLRHAPWLILALCSAAGIRCGESLAGETIEIVQASGKVSVRQEGQADQPVETKSILPAKHTLVTGPDGRAVIRVGESGYLVVEKNSAIEVDRAQDRASFLRHLTGMIYYALHALRASQRPVEVRTMSATIGVRGTRFMIADTPQRKEVAMRKGTVSITSEKEDFEIHRKAEQDEFEALKQEAMDAMAREKREFEEYKAQAEREFIEYKREFALGANRMVRFDGKRVDDRPLSGETQKDMETLEAYGREWIAAVRD